MRTVSKVVARTRRHTRVRRRVGGTTERPRLVVFRSNKHVYAQVIDDVSGRTLAAASTLDGQAGSAGTKSEAARRVGELLGTRAKEAGVGAVVFDRGGYLYHGRVRQVAEGARASGLEF